jgi:3-methyladenine DNA glycosylase AlkD
MTNDQIIANIREDFQRHSDPAIIQKYSRYFKEGFIGYGLPKGHFEAKVDELLAIPGMDLRRVLELAGTLISSPKYEEVSIPILMTIRFHKSWDRDTFRAVEGWFSNGITNWAHTDYVCGEILSLLFEKKFIGMSDLEPWRKAGNKFQRRAAVVGLIKPMKLSTDFEPYFDFIDPMMMDAEREVHQGLGWFLREAWKKQPEPTEEFLFKWKDKSARLIFQYATEKMTKENKECFRKTR